MTADRIGVPDFRSRVDESEETQVIAFHLGGEVHACDIMLVEEVVTRQPLHPLPDVPPQILGVLRLRGELVPVLDIAPALDLELDRARTPAVLVLDAGTERVGVAVDDLYEVLVIPARTLRPPPLTGGERDSFVVAVARVDEILVTLIDLAEILREQTTLSFRETS